MSKPHVAVMIDVPNWAWARKAEALQRWLSDEFDVVAWSLAMGPVPEHFNLYHTFDFPNVNWCPAGARILTGCTAHVWPTWGPEKILGWAAQAWGLHANSRLLEAELQQFGSATASGRVYYTPNGVEPGFWCRTRPRRITDRLVVGHVGKPNPRKGAELLVEACRQAGVELRLLQRRSQDALSPGMVRDFYQDLHLLLAASDMDGTPNPALEAAACEVAVLSNPIGNMPEFIEDGVNGWLLADRTVEDYTEQLTEAKHQLSEVVAMGVQARLSILGGWTWQRQAEHYRTMWREVLAAGVGPGVGA